VQITHGNENTKATDRLEERERKRESSSWYFWFQWATSIL